MKQNTPKLLIFLTCFLAFVLSPQACSAAEQSNTTSAYFDAHKDHLRKLVLLGQNEHLMNKGENIKSAFEAFDKSRNSESEKNLLRGLVTICLTLGTNTQLSGESRYLQDSVVVGFLVRALHEPDVREVSHYYLAQEPVVRPDALRDHISALRPGNLDLRDAYIVSMLGRLDTLETKTILKKWFETHKNSQPEVRARLGDVVAERALISEFLTQTNAESKAKLALKLGYAATPGCVYALAREMRTPLIGYHPTYKFSVRYQIIQALGQALPDEKLFNEEFGNILYALRSRMKMDGDDYINKVEKWCETSFDIKWQSPRPPFLLKVETPTP